MKTKNRKIYVATDLEGVSGVWMASQVRDRSSPLFIRAAEYLMDDIAALVRGLLAAGVSKIIVEDGHGGGDNFLPHLMVAGASYITGRPRKPMDALNKSFDGVVLLGYHAMKGTPDGVLNHTQSSRIQARYWYNGRESGEIAQTALIAGKHGVPVIMVTGDVAACREAKSFLGEDIVTVATKRGISREAAELYPFADTRKAITDCARQALKAIPRCKPYKLKMPIKCKREWIKPVEPPAQPQVFVREASINSLRNVSKVYSF